MVLQYNPLLTAVFQNGSPVSKNEVAQLFGQVRDFVNSLEVGLQDAGVWTLSAVGGSASAVTGTLPFPPDADTVVLLVPPAENTGPTTLAVNGGPARPIMRTDSTPLRAGDLKQGQPVMLRLTAAGDWRVVASGLLWSVVMAAIRSVGVHNIGSVAGTANAITGALPFDEVPGETVAVIVPAADNTGPVTLKLGANPVRSLMANDSTNLAPGDLKQGQSALIRLTAAGHWRVVGVLRSEIMAAATAEAAALVAAESRQRAALASALGPLIEARTAAVGQAQSFSALSPTSTYVARVYAILTPAAGRVRNMRLYCSNTAAVSASVIVWSFAGGLMTQVAAIPVTLQPGYNAFPVDLDVPAGGAVGLSSAAQIQIGYSNDLPAAPFYYSSNAASSAPFSPSQHSGAGTMLSATLDYTAETVSPRLTAVEQDSGAVKSLFETVTDRYGQTITMSGMTSSVAKGAEVMAAPAMKVTAPGRLSSLRIVATTGHTARVLVWNDDGAGNLTLASSTPVTLAVGYNNVALDIPVAVGQVLGLGSRSVGTDASAAPITVAYSNTAGTTSLPATALKTTIYALWAYTVERQILSAAATRPIVVPELPTTANNRTCVLIGHGQSNMRGENAPTLSAPAYLNTMFDGGLLTQGMPVSGRTRVRPIAEGVRTCGLSWAAAYATELEMAARSVASADLLRHKYFAACPAQSGARIEYLLDLPEGVHWPSARDDIRLSAQALDADGQLPHFAAFAWVQGFHNQSTPRAEYAAMLRTGFASVLRAGAGMLPGRPLLIAAQMPFHIRGGTAVLPQTPLAVMDVVAEVGGAVFPLYPAEWGDDGVHMTQRGNVYKGLMIGKLLYDMTQGAFYEPVRMRSVAWGASALTVTLAGGNGSYAFDTSAMPAVPNMGFDLYSAAGTLIDGVITGVSLSGPTVTIGLNRPVASGERLAYGYGRNGFVNPTNAAPGPYTLGNLRDTDPRTRDAAGVTHRLWNWGVIHEVARP